MSPANCALHLLTEKNLRASSSQHRVDVLSTASIMASDETAEPEEGDEQQHADEDAMDEGAAGDVAVAVGDYDEPPEDEDDDGSDDDEPPANASDEDDALDRRK